MVRDINLELYEGEIVGIAGLMGAGRTETTRAIFGIDPKESGEIFIDGKEVKISVRQIPLKQVWYWHLRTEKRRSLYKT